MAEESNEAPKQEQANQPALHVETLFEISIVVKADGTCSWQVEPAANPYAMLGAVDVVAHCLRKKIGG